MREVTTLSPKLSSLKTEFLRRCSCIAERLAGRSGLTDSETIGALRVEFLEPVKRPKKPELEEELHLVTVMSVVIDLVGQGWNFESTSPEVTLFFERNESIALDKERIRRAHTLDRDTQLSEASVAQFIKNMERRRLTPRGWHSIFSVMRDGEQLASELSEIAASSSDANIVESLGACISPYLQFVTPEATCQHTGLRLNDIWRYFRHTWVNSYRSVPGRSMMILVRDAAGPNHPIIGIAALGSSVVQSSVRDRWIGWDADGTCEILAQMKARSAAKWVLERTESLIADVYVKDLLTNGVVTPAEIRRPTLEAVARLEDDAEKSIKQHRLYPLAAKQNEAAVLSAKGWRERAAMPLFRSKRSKQLARLLKIRLTLQTLRLSPEVKQNDWKQMLASSQFRITVGQLIRSVKAERVGINMMDITVCGAIAPYNHLLGGKLVCMLLCSPEVSRECAERYGNHVSIIASAMQGKPVKREASLALLCTTSLYGSGLSQYSRVKIPAEIAGGREGKIEYKELGVSEGFGSFHFSKDTLKLFGMVLGRDQHARKVNSIFGEGVNPLMRKIRDAMAILGLPAESLLRHGNRRVVYGVSLANNTSRFLGGFDRKVHFSLPQTHPVQRTADISRYWSTRWLTKRLQKLGILDEVSTHRLTYPVRHGARVQLPNEQMLLEELLSE